MDRVEDKINECLSKYNKSIFSKINMLNSKLKTDFLDVIKEIREKAIKGLDVAKTDIQTKMREDKNIVMTLIMDNKELIDKFHQKLSNQHG